MRDRSGRKQRLGNKGIKLDSQEKKVKESKEKLRKELLDLLRDDTAEREYLLPVATETIPDSFFDSTGMTEAVFLQTRYPGWKLIKKIKEENATVFLLQKLPEYIPTIIDLNSSQIVKSVVEFTPEIDGDTLEKEFPDIAKKISKEIVVKTIDDNLLEQEARDNPEIFSILRRHTKNKLPANKFRAKIIEEQENDG